MVIRGREAHAFAKDGHRIAEGDGVGKRISNSHFEGRAVLNPRFAMKPRWFAPLREGGCPGGAGGSIPYRAKNRRHEVLPPALRATPLSEGGGSREALRATPSQGGACVCFRHSAIHQQAPSESQNENCWSNGDKRKDAEGWEHKVSAQRNSRRSASGLLFRISHLVAQNVD